MRSITIYVPTGHGLPVAAYTSAQLQKVWYLLDKCRYYAEQDQGFYLHKGYHSEQIGSAGFTWAKGQLLEHGVIRMVPYINKKGERYNYATGKAARYSLRPDLVESPLEPVDLGWTYLRKYLQSSKRKTEEAAEHFPELVERVLASELDYTAAREYVAGAEYNAQQRGWRLRLITGWQQGFKWAKYSHRSGRLFTCISCLPKDLRCFLRWPEYTGDLVEVDAKNCQPYLLSALCYYATGHTRALELASRGEFYEEIMRLCPELSRSEVKKGVLQSLYDHRVDPWHPAGRALAVCFPELWAWVCRQDRTSGSNDHLAIQMQHLEAEWFLGAATQLAVEFPDPVATIHDALIVPESQMERSTYLLQQFCRGRFPNIPVLESLPISPAR